MKIVIPAIVFWLIVGLFFKDWLFENAKMVVFCWIFGVVAVACVAIARDWGRKNEN